MQYFKFIRHFFANTVKQILPLVLIISMLPLSSCTDTDNTDETKDESINTTETNEETEMTKAPETEAPEIIDSGAKIYIKGNKFMVNDREWWCNGVNTPWQYWNDFDGRMNEKFWDDTFAMLAEDNVNCTRIWINCADTKIVQLSADGEVKNVLPAHWRDLEALFELASKHKVYIMATFLSFDHFKNEQNNYELWRKMIKSEENCQSYAEKYVREFCERFGEEEYLFAIDLMNEPDWVYENTECGKIDWKYLSYFFGVCANTVHETCSTPVTVGLGMPKYNSDKYEGNMIADKRLQKLTGLDGATIDFYSTHYYPWERQWFSSPYERSVTAYGLDSKKPCMLGEVSGEEDGIKDFTTPWAYEKTYDNGFAGAMIWIQTQNNKWAGYDLVKDAASHMYSLIPDKIKPLG